MSILFIALLFLVLPLHYRFPQVAADLNSDKQALLEFAAAVPHARKLNWNASAPICKSWVRITCNLNGTNVVILRLPGIGLFGSIPANTIGKLKALRVLSLRSNNLNGDLPSDIPSIPSLRCLYLQHNNFSSVFPTSLSPRLRVLDLSYNSFTGTIPSTTVQSLTKLTILILQNNSIYGAIPHLNLPSLKVLNFSYNNWDGKIPNSLERFPFSSFIGNPLLCGSPLKLCSSSPSPSPSYFPSPPAVSESRHTTRRNKLGSGAIIAIVIGGLSFLFLLLVVIFIRCWKRTEDGGMLKRKISAAAGGKNYEKPNDFGSGVQEAEKNKLFFFEGCSYNFDLEDLLKASAEVLGKGSYGTTYKAALDEGTQVVVKRLKEVAVGKREFEQQMEVLERVGRHPNVVPLRAYYYSKDEKLLVYNYMPAGSLFSLLHGNRSSGRSPLDWDTRMRIALETARGIAHIHTEGGGKCSHGNIKSSNVLLTNELEACVSDVGLAPLMNAPVVTMSRVIGYRAPEVIETHKVTQKSDVYSFGVLLLEMLTAKAPLLPSGGHDEVVDLPRWVRSVVREEWTAEVFDVELLRFQSFQEEMVQMLQIALACVARAPEMRPKMDEAVVMIEDIRQSESKNRTSSEAESNIQTP